MEEMNKNASVFVFKLFFIIIFICEKLHINRCLIITYSVLNDKKIKVSCYKKISAYESEIRCDPSIPILEILQFPVQLLV
jgi:hypothetical protein